MFKNAITLLFALVAALALAAPSPVPANADLPSTCLDFPSNHTDSHNLSRRGAVFNINRRMWKHTSCGPNGTNCVSAETTVSVVKGPCNDDCSAPRVGLDYNGNMCNTQFTVCGRKVTLKSSGEQYSCKKMKDLAGGKNGRGYALIYEGSKKVGSCSIDFSSRFGKNCISSGAYGFESRLYCRYY